MQKSYDVIIAGLGTAGSIAAIKCAASGLSVLGIDRLSESGGTGTAGGICAYYYGSHGGYYEKINQKAKEIQNKYFTQAPYDVSGAKSIASERELVSSGVDISYNTHILSVKKDGNRIISVSCICEGEKFEAYAKIFIDCTGNGDLSKLCGCEFIGGRETDNVYMPYTNPVFIADPSCRVINRDSGLIDMSDNTSYSKELVHSTAEYPFSWQVRGNDASYLKIASLPGVRESRKVVCEKTVTFEDAIFQKPCKDTVFYAFSNADTHEKCIALEPDIAKDWYAVCNLWGVCMSVPVPMQALIPKGFSNLLCAGRMISVDHTLSSVVRMKSDMEKCGEAVSYMSYLAISKNSDTKDILYSDLLPYLEESGVLDEKNNVGFLNRTKTGLEKTEFSENLEELENDLATDRESFGVFAAKHIENSAELLVKLQNSTDRKGKFSAIALGRMGDVRAIPVLREIAKNRDMTLPSGLKMTVPIGISALYLLTKLNDKEIIPLLKEIISDKGKFDEAYFVSNEMFPRKEDLSFQFITHAVSNLKEFSENFPEMKEEIYLFLKEQFFDINYSLSDQQTLTLNIKAGHKLIPSTFDYSVVIKNFILS